MGKKRKLNISFKNADKKLFFKAIIIVASILIILAIAAIKFGSGNSISGITGAASVSDGFPYKVSSNDIERMSMCYNDIALLGDTGLKIVDRTGRTVSDFQHNYSAPLMYSYGRNMLILDAGSNKFRVQTAGKLLYEKEFEFELLTGDISKNGSVAIASKSDQGASMLSVFDAKQKEVFSWVCAKQQIVSVDISENGKLIAVGVLGAEGGDIVSDVYLFDIGYKEPLSRIELPGTSVVRVEILSGKRFVIIGDNLVSFVNQKGERNDVDVSLDTVSKFYVSDNNITAVLLSRYSSAYSNILKVYSSSGKEISSIDIDYTVNNMYSDGKHISLVSDGKLTCFDLYGRITGEKEIDHDAISSCVNNSNVYVLFSNSIKRFSVRGNSDERVTQASVETVDEINNN